ncbi:MAG: hypothetical protein H6901_10735 [Rhodobacteraceae bacterium]|nr:hypothetical protein [Paracoccaceae bacterium]MCP5342680.1 hypothetical protein [Paracoccaceae bacterium]
MDFSSPGAFQASGASLLAKGPVALIFIEDPVEIAATIDHHARAGFRQILAFTPRDIELPATDCDILHRITCDTHADGALVQAVNGIIDQSPETTWLYYCYNAEFLFHPFCESRNIREMIAFHSEERRDAMLCYVVDLYASDLDRFPDAVCMDHAMMDRSGYYAQARKTAGPDGQPRERQLDFFGGLRWRFEEHIPVKRRKIDRIALFRATKGLRLNDDHTFNIEEYNTFTCPWHHNLTAAIASFRTAKALRTNPGSMFDIQSFMWHNSTRFEWKSQQLMDLGLMEPGQWF